MPATIQAVRSDLRAGPALGGGAGWPHRWQNRAWVESRAWQAEQVRGARLAPQPLQKLPSAGPPQAGQMVGVAVMTGER